MRLNAVPKGKYSYPSIVHKHWLPDHTVTRVRSLSSYNVTQDFRIFEQPRSSLRACKPRHILYYHGRAFSGVLGRFASGTVVLCCGGGVLGRSPALLLLGGGDSGPGRRPTQHRIPIATDDTLAAVWPRGVACPGDGSSNSSGFFMYSVSRFTTSSNEGRSSGSFSQHCSMILSLSHLKHGLS